MNRTGTVLPEFCRTIWSSEAAQSVWEPRINQVSNYILNRERETCLDGRCSIQVIEPTQLPTLVEWASKRQLAVSILTTESRSGTYQACPMPYVKGRPWVVKVVVSPIDKAKNFLDAWYSGDHREIGNRLGFPPCCTRFFQEYWVNQKFLDTTWPMGLTSHAQDDRTGEREIFIDAGHDECNILLRWIGVRAVPHLPCSFYCVHTKFFSDWFHGPKGQEYDWLMEMLSWPVEWSALHGIARIKTPILEVSARTDHTNEKYTVRRVGKAYPKEGARGLVFPFRSEPEQEGSLWVDNGFSSRAAMEAAHATVVQVAQSFHYPHQIVDLGCGNGLLLEKLKPLFHYSKLIGLDSEVKRWRSTAEFRHGYIQDWESESGGAGIISVNRFEEIGTDELMKALNHFSELLVYSYNGKSLTPPGWHSVVAISIGENTASLFRRSDLHYDAS